MLGAAHGGFVFRQGGGGGFVDGGGGQNARTHLRDLQGTQCGGVGCRVPRCDQPQRFGQCALAAAARVQPQHGALGSFLGGLVRVGVQGDPPGARQHGVVQQTGQVVFLGGQVAFLQLALKGDQRQSLAGIAAVGCQQVGQLAAAEHRVLAVRRHKVRLQRHGTVHAVDGCRQRIGGVIAVGSQQGGGVACRHIGGRRKHSRGCHIGGALRGQGVVAAAERHPKRLRLCQPGGQRFDKVAPLCPRGILQRRHGVFAQQGGQRRLVGPVAVQAAAHRQAVGIGGTGAVGGSLQQGVAVHRQRLHAVGLIVGQQQGGGTVPGLQRNILRGAVRLQRRKQRRVGVGGQRLRRRGVDFLYRAGGHRLRSSASRQQRRRRQRGDDFFDRLHSNCSFCKGQNFSSFFIINDSRGFFHTCFVL